MKPRLITTLLAALAAIVAILALTLWNPFATVFAPTDTEMILGDWIVGEGTDPPEVANELSAFGFAPDWVTLTIRSELMAYQYCLDTSQEPKWIDLVSPKGKVLRGIYEFTADQLRIGMNFHTAERATAFESSAAPNEALLVLRRSDR